MTRAELEIDLRALKRACGVCAWDDAPAIHRAMARLRADLARMDGPADGLVRVRIAVFGDSEGRWAACGAHDAVDSDLMDGSSDIGGPVIAWITADVPKPRVVEVAGTVER